jgi:recombination protein RecT
MSNQISKIFNSTTVKSKFESVLGNKSQQFIMSVLAAVNNNKLLEKSNWETIYQAAMTAAVLDLPINQNLGFAYIVPFKIKDSNKEQNTEEYAAQFQIGYKGFIQLAQRTGKYKTINVTEVKEGEIIEFDRLTGNIKFKWIDDESRLSLPVVGYVAYFELLNGFSKLLYMTKKELESHGKKYSQSFKRGYGLWQENFDSMSKKTVLKLLLSKYGPVSTDIQTALERDQAVINKHELLYADNITDMENQNIIDVESQNKEDPKITRAKNIIRNSESIEDLEPIREFIDTCDHEELKTLFINKLNSFKND